MGTSRLQNMAQLSAKHFVSCFSMKILAPTNISFTGLWCFVSSWKKLTQGKFSCSAPHTSALTQSLLRCHWYVMLPVSFSLILKDVSSLPAAVPNTDICQGNDTKSSLPSFVVSYCAQRCGVQVCG